MRKLIVSNFVTLDGLYEGKDKSINSLYDYYHEDYARDDSFKPLSASRQHRPQPQFCMILAVLNLQPQRM